MSNPNKKYSRPARPQARDARKSRGDEDAVASSGNPSDVCTDALNPKDGTAAERESGGTGFRSLTFDDLPRIFADRMAKSLKDAFTPFTESYKKPSSSVIRLNRAKTDAREAADLLDFPTRPLPWYADALRYDAQSGTRPGKSVFHEAGLYYIQEASATLPPLLCPPSPGEKVLDLCAAPGGKATRLGLYLEGDGLLVANEIISQRCAVLSRNIERMGIANALVTNHSPRQLSEVFPSFFDKIWVDAPCSGEGMFRKEPDALTMWSPENVSLCAARQDEILSCAADMLKPGGVIVYSTCTFSPEENEGTVARFLTSRPDFDTVMTDNPDVLRCLDSGILSRGNADFLLYGSSDGNPPVDVGAPVGPELRQKLSRCIRVFPHLADGEGHFAAILQKSPDADTAISRRSVGASKSPSRLTSPSNDAIPALDAFCRQTGVTLPDGHILSCVAGNEEKLFHVPYIRSDREKPADAQDVIARLSLYRTGLHLGTVKSKVFTPDHALALALTPGAPESPCVRTFGIDAQAAGERWLHGDTLPCKNDLRGWYLVTVAGHPLGWGKAADGVMKNHYPKGLRR